MKIAIFYHISQMGMSPFVYQSQLHRLYTFGLIEEANYIHFGVNGSQELFNVPDKVVVHYNQEENWGSEKETLLALKKFCDENNNYKVLYFHTKGVSKDTIGIHSWRLMMEYYVIDKWKECIDTLNYYNTTGFSLGDDFPHFTGNFWWANSSYIQTLKYDLLLTDDRYDCENWIGTGKEFKPKEFHKLDVEWFDRGNSLYWDVYPETKYIK